MTRDIELVHMRHRDHNYWEDYAEIFNDTEAIKYLEYRHKNIHLTADKLEKEAEKQGLLIKAIVENESFLGIIRLHGINHFHSFADLHILINSAFHGEGIGTEAVKQMIALYKSFRIITGSCYSTNIGMNNVFTRNNFALVASIPEIFWDENIEQYVSRKMYVKSSLSDVYY